MDRLPRAVGGIPLVGFETLGSTNAEALARAKAGEPGPVWIVAERQTAGHGRRGRRWVSEPGNLYASLLLSDPAPSAETAGICFVGALALHDALLEIEQGLSPERLKLKWPNDLMLDGKKIAGILVEAVSAAGTGSAVVTGFGVNCRHHPDHTELPATDLAAAGFSVSPIALLAVLGETFTARLREWDRGGNYSAIRSDWIARASGIGDTIEVRLADRTLGGLFESIDDRGALVLKLPDGKREIVAAGDVFPISVG